jgi:hypothetical protein
MILSCFRCKDHTGRGADYQNRVYGHGERVHNATAVKAGTCSYRCTICGSERSAE